MLNIVGMRKKPKKNVKLMKRNMNEKKTLLLRSLKRGEINK